MFKKITFLICILTVVGCASVPPQLPLSLDKSNLPQSAKIVVVSEAIPKTSMTYPGASCLLCLAAAATANSGISSYIKELDYNAFGDLQEHVVAGLEAKGYQVVSVDTPIQVKTLPKIKSSEVINYARHDFSSLGEQYDADFIFVIDIDFVGMQRMYASYAPTSAPLATVVGKGYIVDLKSKSYVWHTPMLFRREADGEWKEPPEYPGLTNAFLQVVEDARDAILEPTIQN